MTYTPLHTASIKSTATVVTVYK